jgi:hypothetical protein
VAAKHFKSALCENHAECGTLLGDWEEEELRIDHSRGSSGEELDRRELFFLADLFRNYHTATFVQPVSG